jgi:hypothetical protein
MQRRHAIACLIALPLASPSVWAQAGFDHQYTAWNALLKKHVRWLADGKQSQVNYRGFAADRASLSAVLTSLSAVSQAQFDGFSKPLQMAFLINAYNAFTVELILSAYPKLKSIKDLGSLLQAPWKKISSPCWASSATSIGSSTNSCAPATPSPASTPQ